MVCNGLGLWLRKKKKSSSSSDTTATTNNTDDSDEEDLTDDVAVTPSVVSRRYPTEQVELSQALSDDDVETMAVGSHDEDSTDADDSESEEGLEDSEVDAVDNWSQEVSVYLDPSDCEADQRLIGDLLKKCRSLVKLVNKSSVLKSHINKSKHEFNVRRSLQLDCKSRWNSTHRLIETILIYKKVINKLNSEKHDIGLTLKQTKRLSSIELEKSDWIAMEAIQHALRPFLQATKLISGSRYPTIGIGFFAVVQIREFLEDARVADARDSDILCRLKFLLLEQMDRYFGKNEKQWDLDKVGYSFPSQHHL